MMLFVCLFALVVSTGLATDEERGKCRTVKDTMLTCLEATVEDLPPGKKEDVNWLLFVRSSVPIIKRDTMKMYPALTDLHANNAHVETIEADAFQDLPDLNWVDISFNKLSKLDVNLFKESKTLYYLNISANPDLVIPKNMPFLHSPKLNWLDVSHCNIKHVYPETFAKLGGLKVLSLAGNLLETIPEDAFKPLHNLYSLDLSQNLFQALSPSLFTGLKHQGLSLYLGRNPWKCDCSLNPLIEWAKNRRLKDEVRCAAPDDMPWKDFKGTGCESTMVEVF